MDELHHYLQLDNTAADVLVEPFTEREISRHIKSLHKRKSPGIDGIQNEHIVHAGEYFCSAVTFLFNTILRFEQIPKVWKTSIVIPIYKGKGKPKPDPNSYRPV